MQLRAGGQWEGGAGGPLRGGALTLCHCGLSYGSVAWWRAGGRSVRDGGGGR